ncbi:hypothetical protein H0H93_008303 [Arthromyces matolae]|nr:hypothetical protein H0H93_008303 [Arthromyces matolae]
MSNREPYECPNCHKGAGIARSQKSCISCGAKGAAIVQKKAIDPREDPNYVPFYHELKPSSQVYQTNTQNYTTGTYDGYSNRGYYTGTTTNTGNNQGYKTGTSTNTGNNAQGYYTGTTTNTGNNNQRYYAANSNQGYYNTAANSGNSSQSYYATTSNAGTSTAGNSNSQSSQANSQYYYQYPPNTQGYYLDAAGNRIYYRQ